MRQKGGGEGTRSCAVVRETDAAVRVVDGKIWFSGKDFNELCRRCVNSSKGGAEFGGRTGRIPAPMVQHVVARGRNGASQDTKGKENEMEEEAVPTTDGVFHKREV